MTAMRVVLDTNIVLMPIINPASNDSWLIGQWREGYITPLTSEETEAELLATLENKFGFSRERSQAIAETYLDHCKKVQIPDPPPHTPTCTDASDQKFITLAYAADADALVSRDQRILDLRDDSNVPIMSWPEFIGKILHSN